MNLALNISEEILPLRGTGQVVPFPTVKSGSPLITEALEVYLREHSDFRQRTVDDYRNHLRYLRDWAQDEGIDLRRFSDLAKDIALEYKIYMKGEFAPNTVNIRLSTLRAFAAWAVAKGHVSQEVLEQLKKIKVDEGDIRSFSDEEMEALLAVPNQATFVGYRNYVMMLVLLDTGIRIKELLAVSLKNVDLVNGEIRLPGSMAKTGRFRRLPLSKRVVQALKKLIHSMSHHFPESEHLFVSHHGKPLNTSTVRHILRDYGDMAGISGPCSPHMFRHTFARLFVMSGGDEFSLQTLLGHTTTQMSSRYVRFFSQDLKKKHDKHSPVETILGR